LPGDATHGGAVNDADAAIMAAHWLAAGMTIHGDFNGDGLVDDRDASILGAHWRSRIEPPLPGDANCDGLVDDCDASILGRHWLQSGMTWAEGDFNDDRRVDDRDAAILAAYWGTTAEQTAEGDSPSVSPPTQTVPAAQVRPMGPVLLGTSDAPRRRIEPLPANRASAGARSEAASPEQLAARDTVFAETGDSDFSGETELLRHRLAWGYELAQRRGQKRLAGHRSADARHVDALSER
jgi:hypothetical protein